MEDGSNKSDLQPVELSPEQREKLLTKFVSERPLDGIIRSVVLIMAAALCLFHIVNAVQSGLFSMDLVRGVHLAAVLSLCFLMFPAVQSRRNAPIPLYDYVLAVLGLLAGLYGIMNYNGLLERAAIGYNTMDFVAAGIGVLIVMEAARRALNPALAIAAGLFILYALLGGYMFGPLSHPGYSIKAVLEHLYLSKEGIFGIPLYVSAMYVILFIIYGAVFDKCGAGKFFIDTAVSLTGRFTGGPAKVSCISSALFGMISGSSVANVMVDGVFNIPMMKKVGFKPENAGAIEATTSTGGQIMPPVMGAAAFVMSEFLNIPYSRIIIAAAIPAILYYVGLYIAIDLQARKQGIRGLPANEIPGLKKTFKEGWPFVVPIVMIVYLIETGFSPMLSVMASMFTVILLYIGRLLHANYKKAAGDRRSLTNLGKEIGNTLWAALYEGGKGAVPVAIACASAGIIVGVVTMTGLGFKIGTMAISFSGGNLLPVLFMTMITSLILGMGIPTTANYIITASIAAPAIIGVMAANAGVSVQQFLIQFPEATLSAHLFAFYFGVAADLTPPVALAAYAGAAIAGADPMKTGVKAFLIGIGQFIVPYFFIFFPILLFTGFSPTLEGFGMLFLIIILVIASIFAINCGAIGYFLRPIKPWLRVLFAIFGIMMILPPLELKIAGLILTLLGCLYQALVKPEIQSA